jgi:hypothetical protein
MNGFFWKGSVFPHVQIKKRMIIAYFIKEKRSVSNLKQIKEREKKSDNVEINVCKAFKKDLNRD